MRRFLATLLFVAGAAGCGAADDIDDIDETINCLNACQAWMDCSGDGSFEVDQCASDCEAMAGGSETFEQQTEICDSCLAEGDACAGGTFQCSQECSGIVP